MKPGPFFKWTAECCATNLAIFRHPAGWSRQVKTLWPGPFWGFNPPILFRRWVGCETQPIARVPRPPSSVKTLGMGKSFKINLSICSRFNDAFFVLGKCANKNAISSGQDSPPITNNSQKKNGGSHDKSNGIWDLRSSAVGVQPGKLWKFWLSHVKNYVWFNSRILWENKTLDSSVMKLCIYIYIYMDIKGSFLFMNC